MSLCRKSIPTALKTNRADEEENKELKKKDIVYDNVAIPEIHFHRKKKK